MNHMKIRKGNLLDLAESGDYDYIMHGCNCFHAMGSGIAGSIAWRYPIVAEVDRRLTYKGGPGKLGDYTEQLVTTRRMLVPGEPLSWQDDYPLTPKYKEITLDSPFTVINLYTQFNPGPDFIPSIFPYAIGKINEDFSGKTIGIPMLGAGIGGGNWQEIMLVLLNEAPDINWEVCVL